MGAGVRKLLKTAVRGLRRIPPHFCETPSQLISVSKAMNNPNPTNPAEPTGIPVRCAYTDLADVVALQEHPRNPNKHPQAQIELLARVIKHQGWRSPIVVSSRSGFVVAGHGRLAAAKLLGCTQVPVDYQNFETEADELSHLLADNRIAELSATDNKELAGILLDLKNSPEAVDLDLTGFDTEALAELTAEPLHVDLSEPSGEPKTCQCPQCGYKWKEE